MSVPAEPDYALLDQAGLEGVFWPRPDHSPPPAGATDHELEVEPGVSLGARLYAFDRSLPTILYFHGNGEVAADYDGTAPLYERAGANLFVVDFRGYGRSGGRPTFATLTSDARPAAEGFHTILDSQGVGGRRFVMGRSLGAHPALEVAARAPDGFAGLIIESGAGSLRRLAGRAGLDPEKAAALVSAHEQKIGSIRIPLLVIHGERDELIPLANASELYASAGSSQRELVVIPGAGHNDLLWLGAREYFTAIANFVGSTTNGSE